MPVQRAIAQTVVNVGGLGANTVVGRFLGDINIVWVAFFESRTRDADKTGRLMQGWQIGSAAIAHALLYPADELK